MKARGKGLSHVGQQRENNEDAFLVDDELGLYLVCDGLGGHAAGEKAARLAVATCRAAVRARLHELQERISGPPEHAELREVALAGVQAACQEVHDRATSDPDLSGMGCTLTLLLISGTRGVMAHVGDTRLYLYRDGVAWQLSTDHTMAADLVRRGALTPEKMSRNRFAGALTRCIGPQRAVEAETLILDVLPDDLFLLCSDGLSGYLEGLGELTRILAGSSPPDLVRELVSLANERGGRDNVTALVVENLASEAEHAELLTLAEDFQRHDDALQRVPLFKQLRLADRLRLLEIAECRSLASGELLLREGDELHGLYIVVEGRIELKTGENGASKLERGSSIGNTSLLVQRSSPASLVAASDARVVVIPGRAFLELARRRPSLGVAMMSELARELSREMADTGLRILGTNGATLPWWDPRRWI